MLKYGMPLLAAIVFVFAVTSVAKSRPVKTVLPPPSAPPRAAFGQDVGAVGLVEARSENIAISLPVPGLVTAVHVQAGDHVQKGQKLFSLDDRDLRAELALRETALDVARARLAKLQSMPRPEDIPPAEAKVREAEQNLADANVQLQLIEGIKDRRAIREEDLQRRRVAAKAAQARFEEAKANLALLKAGAWEPDLQIARAEVAQGERQVLRIRADLERLTVTAPLTGTILQCKVRVGEYAQAGPLPQPLMLMGAAGELHVRADVDEQDALRVGQGAPAVASPRGHGDLRIPLRYVRVEPYVIPKRNLTGESTERVDTRVLQVVYALPPNAPVYAGQQMDVYIQAKQTEVKP